MNLQQLLHATDLVKEQGMQLLAYRGSIAHGMYIPGTDPNSIDDIDLMGFVIAPPEYYLGLHDWGSRGTKEIKQNEYDIVLYEYKKAFQLLLRGNPNILSMLWLRPEDYLYNSGGQAIIRNRSLFLGKHVYDAFAGYAYTQMQKMEIRDPAELRMYVAVTSELKRRGEHPNSQEDDEERGKEGPLAQAGELFDVHHYATEKLLSKLRHYQRKGENLGYMGDKRKQLVIRYGYDTKNAAHLIRLLRMCIEFLDTGELIVYRKADAAELLEIKRGGKWSLADVKCLANYLFEEAKKAKDRSFLPPVPDIDGAERLLVELIRQTLV